MIIIRKATTADIDIITDFQIKMAWETERLELDPDVVNRGVKAVFEKFHCGEYWVAEEDGVVISSLLITHEWSDWRNSNVWWIQSVYVLPVYRRQGIFRAMYLRIRNEAVKDGAAGLRLYVETTNYAAQQTYEALGMESKHYKMYEWLKS